jgi:hypothetical protein
MNMFALRACVKSRCRLFGRHVSQRNLEAQPEGTGVCHFAGIYLTAVGRKTQTNQSPENRCDPLCGSLQPPDCPTDLLGQRAPLGERNHVERCS